MVEKLIRLTAEQRSNFVAYLDGELDEQQSREIEQLLSQNEVARHEMESLAATWEMLDVIPRPQASESFSQKTMETLQLENREFSLEDHPWVQSARQVLALAGGWVVVVLCGVVGFVAARSLPPAQADSMIQNYPLLQQLDRYQEVGTPEFLERLQRNNEWSRRQTHSTERGTR